MNEWGCEAVVWDPKILQLGDCASVAPTPKEAQSYTSLQTLHIQALMAKCQEELSKLMPAQNVSYRKKTF